MNKEIKETLDSIKSYITQYKNEGGKLELSFEEWFAILDYITNLQEENEKLDYNLTEYTQNYLELQQIKDKAIEYINKFWKRKSYYEDVDNCMKYANMNEWEKEDLLNILQGEDKE